MLNPPLRGSSAILSIFRRPLFCFFSDNRRVPKEMEVPTSLIFDNSRSVTLKINVYLNMLKIGRYTYLGIS